jgi:PAS domain S-box-containing protein
MASAIQLRQDAREVFFNDLIVSKTDLTGRITYANDAFCRVAGYSETELLGKPHSIIRHPEMPRAVFKYLWDTLLEGREVFAYVKNLARSGDFYWVFAHVTPSRDARRKTVGYHSNRRVPDPRTVRDVIVPIYAELLREEGRYRNGKDSLAAGYRALTEIIAARNVSYDELIFSL